MKRKSHLVILVLSILVCPLSLMIIEARAQIATATFSSQVTLWEQIGSPPGSTIDTTKEKIDGSLTFGSPWIFSATGSTTSFDCSLAPNLIQGLQGKKDVFAGYGAGLCDIGHGSTLYTNVPSGIYMTGSVKVSRSGTSATVSGRAESYFGQDTFSAGLVAPIKFSYDVTVP